MDVIDGKWIEARLSGVRGERTALARHMRVSPDKITKILKGERTVRPQEVPLVLDFFRGSPTLPVVENGSNAPPGTALVPVYDISASAGPGAHVDDYESVSHSLAFPPEYLSRLTRSDPRNLAIISVKGDSMVPTLKDDDIVMLDMSKTNLSYDGLFVLRFGDALHVKRVARSGKPDHITIVSDNNRVPAQDYPSHDVQVIGKVIWGGGKM